MGKPAVLGVLILLTLGQASLLPAAAQDEGLGVTPPSHSVDAAQRGEAYERVVTIQNEFDSPSTITVEGQGEVGNWTHTTPASGFTIAPRSQRDVTLTILVPDDAPNGRSDGATGFVTEPKGSPDGSGVGIRYSVTVSLNVTVGGQANEELTWLDARADDVEEGDPPRAYVSARNDGNVRTTGRVQADVLPFAGQDTVLASGSGQKEWIPGEEAEVAIVFTDTVPLGQYRMRIYSTDPAGFERVVEFKVVPIGTVAKEGRLVRLQHDSRIDSGDPLRITGVFENAGAARIVSAKLSLDVYAGDRLVESLESDALVAEPGVRVNLTVTWSTGPSGEYRLVGIVTYDGYRTQPNESLVSVRSGLLGSDSLGWIIGLGLLLVVLGFILIPILARRRKDKKKPPHRGHTPVRRP